MKDTNELNVFLKRYNLDGFKRTLLKSGISNMNYALGNKYALKIPYDSRFINLRLYQIELQRLAAKNFLSPNVCFYDIAHGYLVTELLTEYHPISAMDINLSQIKKIVILLKSYQKLDVGSIDIPILNYQDMLDNFRLDVNPHKRIYIQSLEQSKYLKNNDVLTHFDLVNNNLLCDRNNNIQLIDFEFACFAPKYFDLVSLLSENKFPTEKKKIIVDEYFGADSEGQKDFEHCQDELHAIFDLLWYHWAMARSHIDNKQYQKIYLTIAEDKKASLLNYLHQHQI